MDCIQDSNYIIRHQSGKCTNPVVSSEGGQLHLCHGCGCATLLQCCLIFRLALGSASPTLRLGDFCDGCRSVGRGMVSCHAPSNAMDDMEDGWRGEIRCHPCPTLPRPPALSSFFAVLVLEALARNSRGVVASGRSRSA